MAKIPIILEPGRADGKLATANSIFDENKSMFQSELNDIQDTLNSDNPNKPLSANQGRILKGIIDAKVIEVGAVPIDVEPIEGNITHVVNSDGLAKEFNKYNTEIILGGVYDVSSHNNRAAFESLQSLLSSADLNTLIPTSVRHGGMRIQFIQSSDNKYVQYHYMLEYANTTAAFVNTHNWKEEDIPTNPYVITTEKTVVNETPIILKKGYKYIISADCQTATIDDDLRQGFYVKGLVSGETTQILQVRNAADWKAGVKVEYTPTEDCILNVRTIKIGDVINISCIFDVFRNVLDNNNITSEQGAVISQNTADIDVLTNIASYKEHIDCTTTKTQVNFLDFFVKKDKKYLFKVKSSSLIGNDNGCAFYTKNSGTPFAKFTAQETYTGVEFEYVADSNIEIGVRTWEVGIVLSIDIIYLINIDDIMHRNNLINKYKNIDWKPNYYGTIKSTYINLTDVSQQYLMMIPADGKKIIKVKTATNNIDNYAIGFTNRIDGTGMVDTPIPFQSANKANVIEVTIPNNAVYIWIYCRISVLDTPEIYYVETDALKAKVAENTFDISILNPWKGKNVVIWGDSITAQGNGDNEECKYSYMRYAAARLGFKNLYVRGIGGQHYRWNTKGYYSIIGNNGKYCDRYEYDSNGQKTNVTVSPLTITAEKLEYIKTAIGSPVEVHYGAFCAWDRISHMIPEAIRTTIDMIIISGGTNDFSAVEEVEVPGKLEKIEPEWIPNDTTDTTWANSTFYNGGDYNIVTLAGAIASTAMKMRLWCPNAVIVIASPFALFNEKTKKLLVNNDGQNFRDLCEIEKYAAQCVGIPFIDANAMCGIDGTTFNSCVIDGVHPSELGRLKYGRVFIGQLPIIFPDIST